MAFSLAKTTRPSRAASGLPLVAYLALWRQRRQLARLTTAQLSDIGISPDAASIEANRPLWDAPATWRS